ncbi:hypothetical protein MasN3_20100 [Massilia varians]|uniref:Uncharacterized protein n=1 Tax=Massilia varians TaxID=457921 RepID=A0ABN6TA17_9BURK|nr:hypothetical protein MasN3_20100 [Massilia varians]
MAIQRASDRSRDSRPGRGWRARVDCAVRVYPEVLAWLFLLIARYYESDMESETEVFAIDNPPILSHIRLGWPTIHARVHHRL